MKRLLIPKHYIEVPNNPVIFLAGPIHAAPRWQERAAKMILKKTKDIIIASPRLILTEYISLDYFDESKYGFFRQRPWEKYYMNRAAAGGTVLFWLSKPNANYLHEETVYGATTRFELGEWMTRYSMDNSISLKIGGDLDFPTIHTIRYDKEDLMGSDFIHDNLESLVDVSIESAYRKFELYKRIPDDITTIKGLLSND